MTQFYQFNQRLRFASKGLVALSLGLLCSFAVGETTSNKISPLSWYPRADLNEEETAALPSFCRGAYRTPEIDVITGDNINTESNLTRMHRNGDAEFEGNAVIQQTDRVLYSDYAKWLYESGKAEFKGGVQLSSPNVVISSEGAALDNNTSIAEFYQAQYAVPANHFRGTARYIEAKQSGQLQLKTATFTYCEPEQKDWSIAASTLNLDNETGVGSAWNTRLQIADIPIMYFPYYRFPISDKRMTGFLNPSFSLNAKRRSSGELVPSNVYVTEAEIPFYINIAPQYDATLTPHYIFEHGYMLDSQFRHKTHLLGDGELNYSYLEKDQTTEEKRYMFNATQKGQWGKYFSHNWVYNQVSDYEYLNDINAVGESDLTTHLPRRGVINFNNSAWHSDITVESFQTVDKTIALQNRPYHRMPQLNFSYKPVVYNQLQINQTFQATRFERYASEWMMNNTTQNLELKELSGFATLNGDRFLSDTSISYPFEVPFGFLTPKVEYRFRSYDLRDGDDFLTDGTLSSRYGIDELDLKPSIASARYSLDGGLYFDREFKLFKNDYQQTLEPRVMWVKSPYVKNQDRIPNFDSAEITVTYASLFTGERFTGGDRLADLDQVSGGLTTRFIRDDGLEQFRASVGQIFYANDRRVLLDTEPTRLIKDPADSSQSILKPLPEENLQHNSSILGEVEVNPTNNLSLFATWEYDPYYEYNKQERYGIRFEDQRNHIFNLATNKVQKYNDNFKNDPIKQKRINVDSYQLDAGLFFSLTDSWAVFGRSLIDLKDYRKEDPSLGIQAEAKPFSNVLESMVGLEYQNCCWRVQFTYRETSLKAGSYRVYDPVGNDITDEYMKTYTTQKRYAYFLTFQFKGLGYVGKNTDRLLNEDLPGYSKRIYHDY